MKNDLIVVAGAGGFIGGHLVARLLKDGARVRAVDKKPLDDWWQRHPGVENLVLDLQDAQELPHGHRPAPASVYNLAADMGGMGFIENNKALCMLSVLINTHLLMAAKEHGVERFFYASSACVYAADKQRTHSYDGLKEEDAYPAMPEDGYGWEKLFSERMCRHFREDFGLTTRVARFHNVYGPNGTWNGGREKAPAAICRKVAAAKLTGEHDIEIWGDGQQTRSFMYIDDCVYGIRRIMDSEHHRTAQPRQRRRRVDQPTGRHRRGHRRRQAQAPVQARRPQRRQRPQQRQHADQEAARLGAVDPPARRPGKDLRLDLRPDRDQGAVPGVFEQAA